MYLTYAKNNAGIVLFNENTAKGFLQTNKLAGTNLGKEWETSPREHFLKSFKFKSFEFSCNK